MQDCLHILLRWARLRSVKRNGNEDFLERCFDVLRAVASRPPSSLAELAEVTGLPKTTVHRVVTKLTEVGALRRGRTSIQLGSVMFELGARVPEERLIRDVSMPYMQHLRRITSSDVNLAVLRGHEVVYLERIPGPIGDLLPGGIGLRLPAVFTGVGKALLAHLPPEIVASLHEDMPEPMTKNSLQSIEDIQQELHTVRRERIAYDREESCVGVSCVAAAITIHGRAVAAISVSTPSSAAQPPPLPHAGGPCRIDHRASAGPRLVA